MKVLSLLQPWASLWVAGAKKIETRSWGTSYRGRVAVHASKRFGIDERHLCTTLPFRSAMMQFGIEQLSDIPIGVILGWVTLSGCRQMIGENCEPGDFCIKCDPLLTPNERAFGNYAPGRFAWLTSPERMVLAEPIPMRGALGLRDLPADLEARFA